MADLVKDLLITGDGSNSNQILEKQKVIDIPNQIFLLEPNKTPLLAILDALGKESCHNPRFEWITDQLLPVLKVKADSAHSPLTTGDTATVTLASAADDYSSSVALDEGDILRNPKGSLYRVTSTDDTNNTVSVVVHSTGIDGNADLVVGQELEIVGDAQPEGASDVPSSKILKKSSDYNYTQIFKTTVQISNTLANTSLYGTDERTYQRRKKGLEHAIKIERDFIFGVKNTDTDPVTGEFRRFTNGLLSFLDYTSPNNTNVVNNSGAAFTIDKLEEWLYNMSRYGSTDKVVFTSGRFLLALNQMLVSSTASVSSRLNYTSGQTSSGLKVTTLMTAIGELRFIHHWLLDMVYFKDSGKRGDIAIAIDLTDKAVRYKALQNRDTKLLTDIQTGTDDYSLDMYITECGLQFMFPQKHGVFFNFGL